MMWVCSPRLYPFPAPMQGTNLLGCGQCPIVLHPMSAHPSQGTVGNQVRDDGGEERVWAQHCIGLGWFPASWLWADWRHHKPLAKHILFFKDDNDGSMWCRSPPQTAPQNPWWPVIANNVYKATRLLLLKQLTRKGSAPQKLRKKRTFSKNLKRRNALQNGCILRICHHRGGVWEGWLWEGSQRRACAGEASRWI